jgi:mono/diheme cytochrome c family protein
MCRKIYRYSVFISWVIVIGIVGYYSKPGAAASVATKPSPALTDPPAQLSANAQQDEQLFNSLGCIGCHRVHGQGGTVGPDLSSGVLKGKSRQWLATQITDPKKHDPDTVMPAFSSLSAQQKKDLIDYLRSLEPGKKSSLSPSLVWAAAGEGLLPGRPQVLFVAAVKTGPQGPPGPAAHLTGNVDRGAELFKYNCQVCHGPQGKDKVTNPGSKDGTVPPLNPIDPHLFNKNPQIFVDHIDPFLQHGSVPKGPNPRLHMLPFGDNHMLTQQEIADLEAYVLSLNGVSRVQPSKSKT